MPSSGDIFSWQMIKETNKGEKQKNKKEKMKEKMMMITNCLVLLTSVSSLFLLLFYNKLRRC